VPVCLSQLLRLLVAVESRIRGAYALPDGFCAKNIVLCSPPPLDAFMNAMEFQIEKNSPVPVIKQIQEQIKLSIAMGVLKRGDVLPPIREVEKQTGINRGQIHRAYLALQKSGLLSPAPSKRTTVAVSAAAPDSVNKRCQELTRDIITRIRRIGVSPIAFARYLSRNVQEDEHKSPFIAYVDPDKESALRRADQVSRLWNASVVGLSVDEFKQALSHDSRIQKVLVNHLASDSIRRVLRGSKMDIIPIEICYSEQTIGALKKLDASSMLVLLPVHAASSARFIVEQLRKWMTCKDATITWMTVDETADFASLLKDSRYERILVSPGARNKVPEKLHRSSRMLILQMELVPEDLEIARIRAGVIV
jgi:DNA-binding transcriptional regulator YhcF (GntR family)